jgi:hypothetical protein
VTRELPGGLAHMQYVWLAWHPRRMRQVAIPVNERDVTGAEGRVAEAGDSALTGGILTRAAAS